MKRLIICISLFVATVGYSQENSAHLDAAVELMKLSNGSVESSLQPFYTQIPKEKQAAFKKELAPLLEDMYKKLAKVAIKEYSHEDIKAMIEFYKTDLGKTMLDGQAKILQASMQVGQEFSMQLMPIYQKYTAGN
jgi:ABC-type oligopeptide transport system ATPase subunit